MKAKEDLRVNVFLGLAHDPRFNSRGMLPVPTIVVETNRGI